MMTLEITFEEDGRKETYDGVASFRITEEQNTNEEWYALDVTQTPTEGKLFKVNPLEIDRSKFENPMRSQEQEYTRKIIQEAFSEVDRHPEKYASSFYTLIPERKWDRSDFKSVQELNKYAIDLGGLMADWVEQALEWAQRIFNGETWEAVCLARDTANNRRMVLWKDGYYRIVGNTVGCVDGSATSIYLMDLDYDHKDCRTVPLVVLKKK